MPFMNVTGTGFKASGSGKGIAQVTDIKFDIPNYTSSVDSLGRPVLGPGVLWQPDNQTPPVRTWFPIIVPGGLRVSTNEFAPAATGVLLWGVNWPMDHSDGVIELIGGTGPNTPGNADPRIPLIAAFLSIGSFLVEDYSGGGGIVHLSTSGWNNTIYSP